MRTFKLVVLGIIVIILALFVFQNLETVNLKLFSWRISFPLSFIIAGFYFLGMLTGGLLISGIKKLARKEEMAPSEKQNVS